MATLSGPCGHCCGPAAFEILGEYLIAPAKSADGRALWAVFTRCLICSKPGYALVAAPPGPNPVRPMQADRNLTLLGWDVVIRGPELREPEAPAHLPDEVRTAFEQAARAARRDADADLTIMGCRRVLEVAITRKDGGAGGTLAARIRALAERGDLTRDLADWAHHIRELGNEAAHGPVLGEKGADRAQALLEFTRLVLLYLFTLPEQVRLAREQDRSES